MTGSVSGAQLRAFIERIERLEEEKRTIADDIKDVKAEAKGCGFDLPTINAILKLRKKDAAERDEAQAMLDLYMSALGMLPLFEEPAASYSEAKGREYPNDFDLSDNESREMRGFVAGLTDEQKAAALAYDGEDGPIGEITDNQESGPAPSGSTSVPAESASDEISAQDDVGATASSTNSNLDPHLSAGPDGGLSIPSEDAVRAKSDDVGASSSVGAAHERIIYRHESSQAVTNPNSVASSSRQPDTAGAVTPPAVPAPLSDDDIPAFIKQDKPDCLKLKDGHCRISFATSALCAECNQHRAMARALA